MNVLAEKEGRSFVAVVLDASGGFVLPFAGTPFPCLVWDHDGRSTDEQRLALARQLLDAGCRFVVCGGVNCEAWHDDVDTEFVRRHLGEPEDVLDAAHVSTTWHEGESVDEVAFYFVNCTNLHGHDFRRFLVLHVGAGLLKGPLEVAVRRHALEG